MSNTLKPIFVATHPRSCSTAFERVFMTRRAELQCVHEPFGDAYYFGPERLAERFASDEEARLQSGFSESTYKTIMDRINRENTEGKRLLIKDMAQYLSPPGNRPVSIAPSLLEPRRGVGTVDRAPVDGAAVDGDRHGVKVATVGSQVTTQSSLSDDATVTTNDAPYDTSAESGNPTVVPSNLLRQFHFAFLIRDPTYSIPSYYRCCVSPLDSMTGFHNFRPDEAGYVELRNLFDYVRSIGVVGPEMAKAVSTVNASSMEEHTRTIGVTANGDSAHLGDEGRVQICVIDAEDLLDKPADVIEAFCNSVGIPYNAGMLNWDTEEEYEHASKAFEKWKGFHEDAIDSKDLKPRGHKRVKSTVQHHNGWVESFGHGAAELISKTVEENIEHYEYLKQFCMKV